MPDETFTVGSSLIQKVHELDLDGFTLSQLLPAYNSQTKVHDSHAIPRGTIDADGHARLSIHSWLVRHEGLTLLIDTGAGAAKDRPALKVLHQLHPPYLPRLAQAGVEPEEVDFVLLTHLHADHVGWNTRRVDGDWVPTFPNATVICSDREWRYGEALSDGDDAKVAHLREEAGLGEPIRIPTPGVFDDSLRPLEAAGRLKRIAIDGEEVLPGVRFIAAPGHSIDHAAIQIVSGGEAALFGGDILHHPLEIYEPELLSMFCEFPDAARRSRRAVLASAADSQAIYFSSHFPMSSAGRISQGAAGYEWSFSNAGHPETAA